MVLVNVQSCATTTRNKFQNTLINPPNSLSPFVVKLFLVPSHKASTELLSAVMFLFLPEFHVHMCFVSFIFFTYHYVFESLLPCSVYRQFILLYLQLYSVECMCHISFIHGPADGYLSCFYCLVIVNDDAMNICVPKKKNLSSKFDNTLIPIHFRLVENDWTLWPDRYGHVQIPYYLIFSLVSATQQQCLLIKDQEVQGNY